MSLSSLISSLSPTEPIHMSLFMSGTKIKYNQGQVALAFRSLIQIKYSFLEGFTVDSVNTLTFKTISLSSSLALKVSQFKILQNHFTMIQHFLNLIKP